MPMVLRERTKDGSRKSKKGRFSGIEQVGAILETKL
jgi:hypothetical protein